MEQNRSIGTIHGMQISAGTPAGAAYVSKVTHPPTTMTSDYQGRPDNSQPNVVLMELKSERNISPILTIPNGTNSTTTVNPSSILFVQTSGLYTSNYVFYQYNLPIGPVWIQPVNQNQTGNQPAISQPNPPATLNAGYNFNNFSNDVSCFRTTYKSSTYYLNATNFNNQGTVTTAKFKPSVLHANDANAYMKLHHHEKLKSQTAINASNKSFLEAIRAAFDFDHKKHKNTQDDGYDVVETTSKDNVKEYPFNYAYQIWDFGLSSTALIAPVANSTNIFYSNVMPATASDIMVSSPKAATRPAKDGAFVVQQQLAETMPWTETTESVTQTLADPRGLQLCIARVLNTITGAYSYMPLYASTNNQVDHQFRCSDTPWNGIDWSYTLFEGLTVPTTVGTTLTSVPYVTVKSFVGCELQVQPKSSLVSFQRTLPLPDPDAINMAVGIMHARPDSLPASANDLGSIALTALKFLPTAVTWLKDLFGSKKQTAQAVNKARVFVTRGPPKKQQQPPKRRPVKRANKPIVKAINKENNKVDKLTRQVRNLSINAKKNSAPASTLPTYQNTPNMSRPVPKPRRRM